MATKKPATRRAASTTASAETSERPRKTPSNPKARGLHSIWIRAEVHARLMLVTKLLALELKQREPSATPLNMGQIAEEAIVAHLAQLIDSHGKSLTLQLTDLKAKR